MKRLLALAIVPIVLASATGCIRLPSAPNQEAPAGDNRPSDSAEEPSGDDSGDDGQSNVATFGETYTWEDGISISVSAPESFTPSEYAVFDEAAAYLAFTITVVNGSDEAFSPSLVFPSLQSGNLEAESVFDSENNLGGFAPSTDILPGREATWKVGFSVSDPTDLVMEISPGAFGYDSAYFTN